MIIIKSSIISFVRLLKTAEMMNNPYTHLTIFDREKIYLWYSQKISLGELLIN